MRKTVRHRLRTDPRLFKIVSAEIQCDGKTILRSLNTFPVEVTARDDVGNEDDFTLGREVSRSFADQALRSMRKGGGFLLILPCIRKPLRSSLPLRN